MDGYSGCDKVKIHLKDEKMIGIHLPKGVFCFKVIPFSLKI